MTGGQEWEGDGVPKCPPLFEEADPHTSTGLCSSCLDAGVATLWKLVAPPEHYVHWAERDLCGPFADLVRVKLGTTL
jgi:hypothetical protein